MKSHTDFESDLTSCFTQPLFGRIRFSSYHFICPIIVLGPKEMIGQIYYRRATTEVTGSFSALDCLIDVWMYGIL